MGEARMNEISSASSANACPAVFTESSCPWHPNTSRRIVAKLLLNSDLDLGTLANLAVQGARAFAN